MNEEEFKKALDELVLNAINQLGAGTVLGALSIVSRFTEVVYDMNVVSRLQAQNQKQPEAAIEDVVEKDKEQ
jgi:hypothetical protein